MSDSDMNGWFKFIPFIDIDNPNEVLGQAVPILSLMDKFGIEYAPSSKDQYKTLCLWHDDSNPSLSIYENTNSYYCWSCHTSGGVIEFMMRMMGHKVENCGGRWYNEAIEELAKMAGITSGECVANFTPPPKRKPEETLEFWIIRAGDEIRKHLQTKEGKRGFEGWNAWAESRFKRMDKMLDSGDDDKWEKAKKYYEITIKQIKGNK